MSSTRGRSNTNERGSARERRARRRWLLSPESGHGGDGESVPCSDCPTVVTDETMYVDRIIPGEQGGRYTRNNIKPHCQLCSCRQGQRRTVELLKDRS